MPVHVNFDNTALSDDSVIGLSLKAKLFTDTFKLGSTPCREVHLQVVKDSVATHPSTVLLYETQGGGTYNIATLHVDNIDDSNDFYYDYTLLDSMIYLNETFEWAGEDNKTVQTLVEEICNKYGITPPDRNYYARTMVVSWEEVCTAREFIGWVAELQGGFAYIDASNKLQFRTFSTTGSTYTYNAATLSDMKLGEHHKITKVVYDNLDHAEAGDDTGDTLFVNPDNILFTDSGAFTIQSSVNNIYNAVKNFEFYNMNVTSVNFDVGTTIHRNGLGLRIIANGYPSLIEYDYKYVEPYWLGGIDIKLMTNQQETTNVIGNALERAVNKIDVTIDRQQGLIDLMGQRVTSAEDTVEDMSIHFQVDANKGEARVTNQNTYEPTSYTSFKGDGMRIYVDDVNVAEATANRFNCNEGLGVQDWVIEHDADASVLMFYRRK